MTLGGEKRKMGLVDNRYFMSKETCSKMLLAIFFAASVDNQKNNCIFAVAIVVALWRDGIGLHTDSEHLTFCRVYKY